ncbi:MAG: S1 RNA-binding domain-containing protein, partial [Desulfuromusa sp.]|nr:S1 RNA-binding domain-containing protein [Desulfuromusa sp.]
FVAGISESLAKSIVCYRDENGAFIQRKQLLKVPRFGKKAFEQAAGFLRIRNAEQPLDNTAVHPERYQLVQQMATDVGVKLQQLVADQGRLDAINLNRYVADDVGLPTLRDIISELKKPGRDPRETFVSTSFRDDVMEIKDLKEGMSLNGIVTNVAAFGAFVDLGVHQDGLVHISQLADRFIKDPNTVVKVGQSVQVRVLEVDLQRKRIALTMRSGEVRPQGNDRKIEQRPVIKSKQVQSQNTKTDLAAALEKSGFRVKKR